MQNNRILSIAAILAFLFPSTCNMALGQEPAAAGLGEGTGRPETVGFHQARYDAGGKLVPWTTWDDALAREMEWYLKCPANEQGYPVYLYSTFMDGEYQPYKQEIIPCTQLGMGILSYIKYWQYYGKADRRILRRADKMGEYLTDEALTPDRGVYPRFPRSTGDNRHFPLERSGQHDAHFGPDVIEPDKGGIAGYALVQLYRAEAGYDYLSCALHIADVLVKNMRPGDALHAPWPFRVDAVTGKHWGERNGNMVYILRLFDALIELGWHRFIEPRDRLWQWIETYQLVAPDSREHNLWVQFFEDMSTEDNRNSWAPLEMARYLIERREALTPDWKAHAEKLIQFSLAHFSATHPGGAITVGEQDTNLNPWGGVCSKLGGVCALFHAAGGGDQYREIAYRNLTWMIYHIDQDGCPADKASGWDIQRGGWQEDCHTDVLHNFVDAMLAVPEWSDGPRGEKARPEQCGFHAARYNADGRLIPWTTWADALDREMKWYEKSPVHALGYPNWVFYTHMQDDFQPYLMDIIPCTQDGMGILSYLKYWRYQEKQPKYLATARILGDYLVKETLTPDRGAYPRFTRSTGNPEDFPLKESAQGDARFGPDVIEPDKGGIAGHALLELFAATGEARYFDQALQNARCLARNMRPGDATRAPWPFRVDAISGKHWGERNGNMVFILRLFDALAALGHQEFEQPREALWKWITTYQLGAPPWRDQNHWIQFFEDVTMEDNRTSWAPLEMARYLIEKKETLDPDWKAHAGQCIEFALRHFSTWQAGGVIAVGEQDRDNRCWGGACSKLGGVAALYYAAGGGEKYGEMAYRNLTWMMYHIDQDGCPAEVTGNYKRYGRAGWQEDCHTDVVHNFIDAIGVVPSWATDRDWQP